MLGNVNYIFRAFFIIVITILAQLLLRVVIFMLHNNNPILFLPETRLDQKSDHKYQTRNVNKAIPNFKTFFIQMPPTPFDVLFFRTFYFFYNWIFGGKWMICI